ncbi:protein mono-ADP-ribosyltransferase PARP12 [Xenopus laevis]|uniref:Poly [ADP-ribose] polymerase 12 n=2 Tax=Xenopus laevis TaxID=8355 RepID=A0A974D8M5_XENLA|nr:protein mono-ADP-ribosyltransferase PARP12 [Xenopus laevis]OCT86145.1 hypothetical protein XELAEV_18019839mg [Xenopus laevis]
MGAEQTVMVNTEGLAARVAQQICSAGGSMELGQLGRSLGLNAQQLERLVEAEEGRSLVFRVQEGDQKVAVYRSALRLCQTPKCAGECGHLHLCRYYVLGSCSRSPCKFNHFIRNQHNLSVLEKHHLDSVPIDDLRQLLLQNDPNLLPVICSHYNRGDGPYGSCTYKNKCNKLHVCQHFLQGDCKFGEKCKRCHNLSEQETLKKLRINASLLPGLLETYINAHTLQSSYESPPRNVVKSPEKKATPQLSKPETPQKIEEICLYFIRNSCSYKEKCVREHFHLPYRWQVCTNGTWKDFDNMEMIEKLYCDPNSSAVVVNLDFETMTYQSNKVKRLSTPSSASKPPHFVCTTDWKWYWMDESNKWVEYGTESDLHDSSTVGSSDLENVYQSDDTADIKFQAGKHEYLLSFQNMVQRNLHYGTKRRVCRRPVFVSGNDVQKKKTSKSEPQKGDKNTPAHWGKGQMPDVGFKLVPLSPSCEEYSKIEAMFRRTLSIRIHSIERIQNLALWEVYQWQKEQMKKVNGGKDPDERQLFHGTSDKLIDAICQQNFDWRICGDHGTAYGKGSYFARDASYSHNYCRRSGSQTLVMFVARVLVGDFTRGNSSYLRPPSNSEHLSTSFYDSCVDSESNPSIFVIFEKHQIYPEYLIKYSDN